MKSRTIRLTAIVLAVLGFGVIGLTACNDYDSDGGESGYSSGY